MGYMTPTCDTYVTPTATSCQSPPDKGGEIPPKILDNNIKVFSFSGYFTMLVKDVSITKKKKIE